MKNNNRNKIYEIGLLIGASICISVLIFGILLVSYNDDFSNIGAFGDSFGVLTSLFSGLGFVGLLVTILMQREDLALQRRELSLTTRELSYQKDEMIKQNVIFSIQKFENTYFKSLDHLLLIRSGISINDGQNDLSGVQCFKILYENFETNYLSVSRTNAAGNIVYEFDTKACLNIDGLNEKYNEFYKKFGQILSTYYRTLYNILKFINSAEYIEDKKFYNNMLRSHLTGWEGVMLFYGSISEHGRDKMAPLVYQFNLLNHVDISTINPKHHNLFRNFQQSGKIDF